MLNVLLDEPYIENVPRVAWSDAAPFVVTTEIGFYRPIMDMMDGTDVTPFIFEDKIVKTQEDFETYLSRLAEKIESSVIMSLQLHAHVAVNHRKGTLAQKLQTIKLTEYLNDRNVMDLILYLEFIKEAAKDGFNWETST